MRHVVEDSGHNIGWSRRPAIVVVPCAIPVDIHVDVLPSRNDPIIGLADICPVPCEGRTDSGRSAKSIIGRDIIRARKARFESPC